MTLQIGILEGDDIGLEVVPETIKVMKAAAQKCGLSVNWHAVPIGMKAYKELVKISMAAIMKKTPRIPSMALEL